MTYIQPRASYSPIGRQPFRPGQWQGFKGVSKHTTYIQNNFFGNGSYGNYNTGYNYGNYNTCCNNSSGGKWMNWLMGIGVGTTLLGGILKLFGKDKEQGSTPIATTHTTPAATTPTETDIDDAIDDAVAPTVSTVPTENTTATDATDATDATAATDATDAEEPTNPYADMNNGLDNMICRDASGRTQNISGKMQVTQAGGDGEPPEEFTITDTSSGTAHVYKYELTGESSDGKPIYTCKSMNSVATKTANAYTLEMNDGAPELVQYADQANYGIGLKFGSVAQQHSNTATQQHSNTATQQHSNTATQQHR